MPACRSYPLQRLVDRLKRERFRAIFDYLRRGSPSPVLNLLETVQVWRAVAAALAAGAPCRVVCLELCCACWPSGRQVCQATGARHVILCMPSVVCACTRVSQRVLLCPQPLAQDEPFMDTIDPEVRADIEYAGRLLAKSIGQRQAAERLRDCASSAPAGDAPAGAPLETARTAASSFVTANTGAGVASSYGQSTNGEVDAAGFVALMEDVIARSKGEPGAAALGAPGTADR